MRFQKRIKICKGLSLNLSKSGVGISAGVKGLKVGVDSKGRAYRSVGLPGTGISDRKYLNTKKSESPETIKNTDSEIERTEGYEQEEPQQEQYQTYNYQNHDFRNGVIVGIIITIVALVCITIIS